MKNILLLFSLFTFFIFEVNAQMTHCVTQLPNDSIRVQEIDLAKYKEAYNYILSDSINQGNIIAVSDSIVDLDRYWFSGELKEFPEHQKNKRVS